MALTHPFCWPYVRRGTERNMEELALYLVGRGHQVTTVSTWPGRSREEKAMNGRRILLSPMWHPVLGRIRIRPEHVFIPRSIPTIRALDVEVVHSFGWWDALAATSARNGRGYRTVLQLNGIPVPPAQYRRFPPEHLMIRRALRGADRLLACSAFVRDKVREYWGVEPEAVIPGVNMERFPLQGGPPDGRPTILSVADFDVPRKGLRVLVQAFARVKREVPDALLRLSGRLSTDREAAVLGTIPPAVRRDVEVLGLGCPEALSTQYGEATITVLPSMWEALGLVLIESMATGTPVVGTAHGGLLEIVEEGVGVLFDPESDEEETSNASGLAEAILRGLTLAASPKTRARCRAHAERFSWQRVGRRIEEIYAE